jgi:hypothetical protein
VKVVFDYYIQYLDWHHVREEDEQVMLYLLLALEYMLYVMEYDRVVDSHSKFIGKKCVSDEI